MLIAREDPSAPRRVRFRSFFGFGEMPNPDNLWGSNGWFPTARDGLGKVPDFASRWGACQSLSAQLDALRSDPLGSAVAAEATQYSNWIIQRLKDAAYNFEWGGAFKRTDSRQQALDAALADLDRGLTGYLEKNSPRLASVTSQIAARDAARAKLETDRLLAEQAAADEARRTSERVVAEQLLLKAQTQKATVIEEKAIAVEQVDLVKQQASSLVDLNKAQKEAMIATGQISPLEASLGSTSVIVGLAAAAGLGIYLYASKRGGRSRR